MIPNFVCSEFESVAQYIERRICVNLTWPNVVDAITHRENCISGTSLMFSTVLPTLVYRSFGANVSRARPLAAAWLLYELASDIFDDIQDRDGKSRPWNRLPPDQAMLTAVGVLFAANLCLADLQVGERTLRDIHQRMAQTGLFAAQGQSRPVMQNSVRDYFRHIVAKSGQIYGTVAWAGARMRTDEESVLQAFFDFGLALGMLVQIRDDYFDLSPSRVASDLVTGNYTLPVLYALSQQEHPLHNRLTELLDLRSQTAPSVATEMVQILEQMNVYAFTMAMAKVYEQKAIDALNSLQAQDTEHMRSYVKYVFASLCGVEEATISI